jgi:hypothetical protein
MIASVSVTNANAVVVLPAPDTAPYRFVAIGNVGSSTAYLKFTADDTALSTSNGIPLPAGASLVCDQDSERDIFKIAVTAICGGSDSTTLAVQAY